MVFKSIYFNEIHLVYTATEGKYWVAIKPISICLGIDYSSVYRRLSNNELFRSSIKIFKVCQPGDQRRSMSFLPENLLYAWMYGLRSSNKALLQNQLELCDLIYSHFHSATIKRIDSIKEKAITRKNRNIIERALRSDIKSYNDLEILQAKEARIGKQLKSIENEEIIEQLHLIS